MKNNIKMTSLVLAMCLILTLVIANPVKVKGVVSDKPYFDIEITSITPNPALEGEDILINGLMKPRPFETQVPAKEIVLVLDVSGSMNDTINSILCDNKVGKCYEHNKFGIHNSNKISELKKAANSFIDKMKDVPNLKIGIVKYSSSAEIIKNNKALIPASDTQTLKSIINGLSANGGTNTGEGLRRTTYLLNSSNEQDSNANKTVILMSDGIPTFYTRKSLNNNEYYIDISQENGGNSYDSGNGSSDNDSKDLGYAKTIGEIIREKGYNAFTIGYGMNSDGNDRMKQIHKSMTGYELQGTNEENEDKGFFATSDGAIDSVFNKIADKILDSYPITNIDFNANFDEGVSLAIGGNVVRFNNVNYEKVSESNGKIRYEAEPEPFSFVIKSSKLGENKLFQNSTITFPWRGETITIPVPSATVNIENNELPRINARLISEDKVATTIGEEIKVKYEIVADEFEFNDSNNSVPKDVVIVLDNSNQSMEHSLQIVKNSLWNKLLNNSIFTGKDIQYGLVTYSDIVYESVELTNNTTLLNDNVIKNIALVNSDTRNIDLAIDKAVDVLNGGNRESEKYLLFIGGGSLNYNNYDFNKIKDKYNVITLAVGYNSMLEDMHNNKLNAGKDNYFSAINDFNSIENSIMGKIAEIIAETRYKPYQFNLTLKLDLNNNFNPVEGFSKINDQSASVENINITYSYSNGKYIANQIEPIEFTISVKEEKEGELEFGISSIIYTNLIGKNVNKLIKTPIITVNDLTSNSNIIIQVRDSNGDLDDKYDSSENTSNDLIRYDKINIKNEFNKNYKLYGDSYADIVLSGKNMNHLKYKIIDATNIENGQTPTLPEEWDGEVTVDDSAHGTINGDIRNQGGIKFPEKQGTYYVAYESGSKVENDFIVEKQGIYGPFVVENRFVLTREIENKNNTELQLNYKIQPNNIDFTDIYRTKGEIDSVGDKYVTELDIVNMQLSDIIPNELEILEQIENGAPKFNFSNNIINGQLSGSIDGRILYTLDNTGIDKTKWKYTADDITISLKVGIGEEGLQINFGEKDGKLTYDDIKLKDDNRHKKEDYFYSANATVEESSKILSQGLFNGKTVQENASINVTSANWYTIGTRFKINSSNSVFDITLPYGAVIDEKNIYLYEATDGVINMGNKSELKVNTLNERLNISNKNNNTTLTKGEYIVVYSIKFTKDENQFVKSSIDRDRNSKLDFKIKRNPDLF